VTLEEIAVDEINILFGVAKKNHKNQFCIAAPDQD
jgi:hypothetical protein